MRFLSREASKGTFGVVARCEVGLNNPLVLAVDDAPATTHGLRGGKAVAVERRYIFVLRLDVPRSEVVQETVELRLRISCLLNAVTASIRYTPIMISNTTINVLFQLMVICL